MARLISARTTSSLSIREVIRGPAALRYGSTSIGGVVSATNNRIPDALPACVTAPFQTYGLPAKAPETATAQAGCVTAETRTAVSSVDRGVEGGILLDAGGGNFAFDQTWPVNERQHQTKVTAKGEYRPDAAAIEAVRFWAGATDYRHNEIGLADVDDPGSLGVRQTFTNKEQEGRVEVQMMPFNARFATVTSAFGLQANHQQLTAPSPDDPGSPLNGLWDPNRNTKVAGYTFNEFKFSESTKAQIAGRVEHVNLSGDDAGISFPTSSIWPPIPVISVLQRRVTRPSRPRARASA